MHDGLENFGTNPQKLKNNLPDSKLLIEEDVKAEIKSLNEDLVRPKKKTFKEVQSSILKKSIEFNDPENKLTKEEKKQKFRDQYVEQIKEARADRRNQVISEYIFKGEDPKNIDQKKVLEKLKSINALLEVYKIENPVDILNRDKKEILAFAKDLEKIVNIPHTELIKEWIEISKENIELRKQEKLIEDEKIANEIYDSVNRGEDVDYSKLYEQNADLLKDETKATEELTKKETELTKPESSYIETLQPEAKLKIESILSKSTITPETFEEVMTLVGGNVEPDKISVSGGNISFPVISPQGLSIPATIVKDEIVLRDRSGDVRIKTGNKDAYKLEIEIFEVKNELIRMENEHGFQIPKDLRRFFLSRDLAKLVNFISGYRARIAGNSDNDKQFEVRKIYEYVLRLPHDQQWKLDKDIEKAKDDTEIKDIAIKLQKVIQ
ncbi:MAG: hypothetical protein AAB836_01635 [Patescibacteria group bacterium]